MSLERVVDILIAHGVGGNMLREYADNEFGPQNPETGQREAEAKDPQEPPVSEDVVNEPATAPATGAPVNVTEAAPAEPAPAEPAPDAVQQYDEMHGASAPAEPSVTETTPGA